MDEKISLVCLGTFAAAPMAEFAGEQWQIIAKSKVDDFWEHGNPIYGTQGLFLEAIPYDKNKRRQIGNWILYYIIEQIA